jgi:hypothetical protein
MNPFAYFPKSPTPTHARICIPDCTFLPLKDAISSDDHPTHASICIPNYAFSRLRDAISSAQPSIHALICIPDCAFSRLRDAISSAQPSIHASICIPDCAFSRVRDAIPPMITRPTPRFASLTMHFQDLGMQFTANSLLTSWRYD